MEDKTLEQVLIDVAIKICKQKKGCILVIENNKLDYAPLIEQDIKSFNILENLRRLELLITFDGACIFNPKGELIAYAVQILNTKPIGYGGTRHQAAYTASINKNVVIISSEEEQKVKIFKDGKLIMQIDALEKNIETKTKEVVSILESIGAGTLGAVGVGLFAPAIALSIIPGILVFGTSHYVFKFVGQLLDKDKKRI